MTKNVSFVKNPKMNFLFITLCTLLAMFFFSYASCYKVKIDDTFIVAKVTTEDVSDISEFSALFHGVVDSNCESISEVGFEYQEGGTEEWRSIKATLSSRGTFAKSPSEIAPGVTYEVRAYVIASVSGKIYGEVKTFKLLNSPDYGTTISINGNVTATIGQSIIYSLALCHIPKGIAKQG